MELTDLNLSEEQLAEVQKYAQSREDKVRTDYSKKLKDTNDELAKYKPIEKSEVEIAFEEKMKALESKEKELVMKERSIMVADKLSEMGLPKDLAQYLDLGDDADTTLAKVGETVNNYFLDNGSKPSNHAKQQGVSREQFSKMSYSERASLLETNPELYKILSR